MKSKLLYPILFSKKYTCTHILINEAVRDEYHHMWGACRDFAHEILKMDMRWRWLAERIDDFASQSTRYMMKRLPVWLLKSDSASGSLYRAIDSIKKTVVWVMNRWVSTLKNLFDPRYSFYTPTSFLVSFDESYTMEYIQ